MELFLIIVALFIAIPTAYAAIIGAPPAPTSKSQIEAIVKASDLKNGDVFYELGTGTGRVITAFAKYKNINVVGFELSPVFCLVTLLNLKLHGIKNYKVYCKNFFNESLEEADVIFCFLMPKTMERLKEKFLKETKRGTKIISYAFEIKGWTPYTIIKQNQKPAVYFYVTK